MLRLGLVLLMASTAIAAPVPKTLKRKPTIDGRWQAIAMNQAGRDIMSSHPTVWDIGGGSVTRFFTGPNGTLTAENMTITITAPDPTRPDEIDYVQTIDNRRLLFRARIQVTADELSIRFAEMDAPCPAEMTEGTDGWLYRFKRVEAK